MSLPFRYRFIFALIFLFILLLLVLRLAPHRPLRNNSPVSTALYDRNGELLRLTLASDDQYRLWVPLSEIDPRLVEAVQMYEDRAFYWHPGFNPWALLRATLATYGKDDKQGGSTLTMQLARRIYHIRSQTVGGKFKQMFAAVWLELRYSKKEILEAYLNLAPYGGNIEGASTASLIYFHKTSQQLTLPEVLTLAVIPQNPNRRGLRQTGTQALLAARKRLFSNWLHRYPDAIRYQAEINTPPKRFTAAALPFRAPHLTDKLLREFKRRPEPKPHQIFSSMDLRLQTTLERVISQLIHDRGNDGIHNASALLIDRTTGEVSAMVGSADYFDKTIHGQVNGVEAKRSPGSTLKPFVYALGLDQGILHPFTVLKDEPTAYGHFSPENFDGRFVGPITAQEALVRSRNIPALAVSAKLSKPSLYDFLKMAGVSQMASEAHYGLALVLGGGEITPEELSRLYLMIANRGVFIPLTYLRKNPEAQTKDEKTPHLLSEEAAFITQQMLATNPRPDTGMPATPEVAWKTGTSWSFRDAWTAGIFGRYVLVVWMGNFDGSGNPVFVGVQSAAPLFFKIVDAIRGQGLDPGPPLLPPPANLKKIEVCEASGDLPNKWCPERVSTWFIPGKSPIKLSTLHRPVRIDTRTGLPTCEEGSHVKTEVFEFWPADLQHLFQEAGMPRRIPPALPDCAQKTNGDALGGPEITSPRKNLTYLFRLSKPTPLTLQATTSEHSGPLFWFEGDGWIGQSTEGQDLTWTPHRSGLHQLRVIDSQGRASAREVEVEFVP